MIVQHEKVTLLLLQIIIINYLQYKNAHIIMIENNNEKMTVPYILLKMMLTGDRVEYLPEGGT